MKQKRFSLIEPSSPKEIVFLRKTFRWSKTDLAREIGVSDLAIRYWERGLTTPKKYGWKIRRLLTAAEFLEQVRSEMAQDAPLYRSVQNLGGAKKRLLKNLGIEDQHRAVELLKQEVVAQVKITTVRPRATIRSELKRDKEVRPRV